MYLLSTGTQAHEHLNLREGFAPFDLVEAYLTIRDLKYIPRMGWIQRGVPVPECESVGTHMLNCGRAAYFYTGPSSPLTDMLMVHDWAEAITGDTTPAMNVDPRVKFHNEYAAMLELTAPMKDGARVVETWLEFERAETQVARIAKQLDKLDAAVMALVYEGRGYDTSEFYPYTRERLIDPRLIEVFDILMQREHPLEHSHFVYFGLLGQREIQLD